MKQASGKGEVIDKPEVIPPMTEEATALRPAAVRVPKTSEIVANQIRRRIIRGELPEGSFLPSEMELMESFSISRPTLREALRVLEAEQVVSLGRGSRTGARITPPKFDHVARYAGFALQAADTTMADIYGARLLIEPPIARTLAETKPIETADALDARIEALALLVEARNDVDYTIGVADFHSLLVSLSGSKTLLMITRMLQGIVARYQVRTLASRRNAPDRQHEMNLVGMRSFRQLARLIREGQGEHAEAHWHRHIKAANAIWLRDGLGAQVIDVFD